MILTATCPSCRADIRIPRKGVTRPDLAHEIGEEFTHSCVECATDHTLHINDVRASESYNAIFFAVAAAVIITAILWMFLGAIGTISLGVPLLIWQHETKAVSTFISYLLRRKH